MLYLTFTVVRCQWWFYPDYREKVSLCIHHLSWFVSLLKCSWGPQTAPEPQLGHPGLAYSSGAESGSQSPVPVWRLPGRWWRRRPAAGRWPRCRPESRSLCCPSLAGGAAAAAAQRWRRRHTHSPGSGSPSAATCSGCSSTNTAYITLYDISQEFNKSHVYHNLTHLPGCCRAELVSFLWVFGGN